MTRLLICHNFVQLESRILPCDGLVSTLTVSGLAADVPAQLLPQFLLAHGLRTVLLTAPPRN